MVSEFVPRVKAPGSPLPPAGPGPSPESSSRPPWDILYKEPLAAAPAETGAAPLQP